MLTLAQDSASIECVKWVPVLPFAMGGGPVAVCCREGFEDRLPRSDVLSPPILAASIRALSALRSHRLPEWLPRLVAGGSGPWMRRGLYVVPRFNRSRYPTMYRKCLDAGAVLSPYYDCPSILPSEASEGERVLLSRLFRTRLEG